MGPELPGMYMETARLRPSTARLVPEPPSSSPRAQSSLTGSLHTSVPAGTVTVVLPENDRTLLVPATVLPEKDCSPTATLPKVTGPVPQVLDRRTRTVSLHRSGFRIMRRVWFCACGMAGAVNGNAKLTRAAAVVPFHVFCGAVVQLATHLRASSARAAGSRDAPSRAVAAAAARTPRMDKENRLLSCRG